MKIFIGTSGWYQHDYTKNELGETVLKIKQTNPEKVYIFFNNDQMLENGRTMQKTFVQKISF